MAGYLLAVDGGGTKTLAVVIDKGGNLLSVARGGPTNINLVGEQAFTSNLERVVLEATEAANVSVDRLAYSCFAIAGSSSRRNRDFISKYIREILGMSNFRVMTDIEAVLLACSRGGDGIVASVGTGAVVLGKRGEKYARAGGWGYLIDDEGSGFYIGRRCLSEAFKAYDSRGQQTVLVRHLKDFFRVGDFQEIVGIVYGRWKEPTRIASLAKIVCSAAEDGDKVALNILEDAASEIALMVSAVSKRLSMDEPDVYGVGGVLVNCSMLQLFLKERIRKILPRSCFKVMEKSPLIGAVREAFREVYGRVDEEMIDRLEKSISLKIASET